MSKFMRNYFIKISPENQEQILIGDTWWYENQNNLSGWTYPNLLTLRLDINRNTFASTNNAHLQILNLAPSTRQRIFHDKYRFDKLTYIDVYAGYGSNLQLIFRGKILQAYSYKQGTNMITDIQAIDLGFLSYYKDGKQVNYSNLTLEAGSTKHEAIKRLCYDMEEGVKLNSLGSIGGKFQTPVSLVGNSFALIDELTGGHVFVDMGKLNILSDKECVKIGKIPVFDTDTGLLGTPMRRDAQLEIDVLFEPSIIVGQLINLGSSTGVKEYNGTFKVVGIHHSGTISSAECGSLTTRFNLFAGVLLPNSDITAQEYANNTQVLSEVKNEDISSVDGTSPTAVRDVFEYIKQNGKAPNSYIPDTKIKWSDVIKSSWGLPTKESYVGNLYDLCRNLYSAVQRNIGNVNISIGSGFRNSSRNSGVGGSSTSLHLTGSAVDITKLGNLSFRNIYNFFYSQGWVRELLLEDGCVHIGINKKNVTKGYWSQKTGFIPIRDK